MNSLEKYKVRGVSYRRAKRTKKQADGHNVPTGVAYRGVAYFRRIVPNPCGRAGEKCKGSVSTPLTFNQGGAQYQWEFSPLLVWVCWKMHICVTWWSQKFNKNYTGLALPRTCSNKSLARLWLAVSLLAQVRHLLNRHQLNHNLLNRRLLNPADTFSKYTFARWVQKYYLKC